MKLVAELAVAMVDADHAEAAALVESTLAAFSTKMRETSFQKPRSA